MTTLGILLIVIFIVDIAANIASIRHMKKQNKRISDLEHQVELMDSVLSVDNGVKKILHG